MPPPRVIGGKYRLGQRIGRGTMGTVWAATHEATNRRVAVKLVSREHAANAEARNRMLREARACGSIAHENVVEVLDAGQTDQAEPFLVMPLLAGESLAARIERTGSLDASLAVRIAIDIAKGLAAAHAAGIVHRDLKPANVFLVGAEGEREPVVKLLDFGISKLLGPDDPSSNTMTGRAIGSPAYMSPEQGRGDKAVDQRSDLWGLGVVLFEMLTGKRAFDGTNAFTVVSAILSGPIPSVADRAPGTDGWIVDLVARCLVRDVEARIPSAMAFVRLARQHHEPMLEPLNDAEDLTVPAPRPAFDTTSVNPENTVTELLRSEEPALTLTTPLVLPDGKPPNVLPLSASSTHLSPTVPSRPYLDEPTVGAEPSKRPSRLPLLLLSAGAALSVIAGGAVIAMRTGGEPAPNEAPATPSPEPPLVTERGETAAPSGTVEPILDVRSEGAPAKPSAAPVPNVSAEARRPAPLTVPPAPNTAATPKRPPVPRPTRRPASSSSVPFDDPG